MSLLKFILFVSLFGILETFAGPKNIDGKVYKHILIVTEDQKENLPTYKASAQMVHQLN